MRRRARGFTLIEIVVVIALVGIVATVAGLSFARSLSGARIEAASRDLVAALRYTRGQAIVKRQQKCSDRPREQHLAGTRQGHDRTAEGHGTAPDHRAGGADRREQGRHPLLPDSSSTGGNIAVVLGEREWKINVGWLTGEISLDRPEETR